METPITDLYIREAGAAPPQTDVIPAEVARRLELDRAALMDALEDMLDDKASLPGKPRWAAYKKARAAVASARANFPTTP